MTKDEIAFNVLSEKTCENCRFKCLKEDITCDEWEPRKPEGIVSGTYLPQYSTDGSIFYNTKDKHLYIYYSKMWNKLQK